MVSRTLVGSRFGRHTQTVEAGRVRLFSRVIGENQTLFTDHAQERPFAPPTYIYCLDMDRDDPADYLELLQAPIEQVLHGEQRFNYYAPVQVGDRLEFESRIDDVFEKKGGALRFVVIGTSVNRAGSRVADLSRTLVLRRIEVPGSRASTSASADDARRSKAGPAKDLPESPQMERALCELAIPPLRRSTLALYAGASGDHNPMHIDIDEARSAGLSDVFAHGMLSMAYLGRLLTALAPPSAWRSFEARFAQIVEVGESLRGRALLQRLDGTRARLGLQLLGVDGTPKVLGTADIQLDLVTHPLLCERPRSSDE